MLKKYFIHESAKVISFVERGETDEKSMHECRVAIKKIRALTDLLSWTNEKFDVSEAEKPYRRLFQKMGPPREYQVHLKLSATLGILIPADAENAERKASQEAIGKLTEKLNKSTLKKLRKQEENILDALDHLSKKEVARYFRYCRSALIKRIQNSGENKLHFLRKKVKTFFYNLKAFDDSKGLNSNKEVIDELDTFQQILGNWHDMEEIKIRLNLGETDGLPEQNFLEKHKEIIADIGDGKGRLYWKLGVMKLSCR